MSANRLGKLTLKVEGLSFWRLDTGVPTATDTCRLCGKTAKLRSSHIIPKFLFKPMMDFKGRLNQLMSVEEKDFWASVPGSGIKEQLLCDECETRFSLFESHGAKLFSRPLPPFIKGSRRVREHPGLDYKLLKLLFLSILWRASVAEDEFFRHVSLGPHEPIVRAMLLQSDPGPVEKYPILIFRLHFGGESMRDFMTEPTPMMFEQRRHYRFVMGGFVIMISVSKMPPTKEFKHLALSPSVPVRTHEADLNEFEFLRPIPNRIIGAVPA